MGAKGRLAGASFALLACLPYGVRASCGQAVCTVDSRLGTTGPPAARALRLDTNVEYIEQDKPWVRHHAVDVGEIARPDHNEVETTNLTWKIGAELGVTDRWAVGLLLPIVHREHLHLAAPDHDHDGASLVPKHADHADEENGEDDGAVTIGDVTGVPERWEFTRLGDLQLTARYALLAGDSEPMLTLFAGLKLPSGETGVRNGDGERAEITLQPGTGSVDPIAGINLRHTFHPFDDGRAVPSFAGVLLRTEGSDGRFGYRPGTELLVNGGAEYPLTSRLHALGQINFRYRDRDHVGDAPGVPAEHTGGEYLYLTPGLWLGLVDRLGAYGYVQVPVYQRVNGIQLVSQWNLLVGLTYEVSI
jgi:hypothetical protein